MEAAVIVSNWEGSTANRRGAPSRPCQIQMALNTVPAKVVSQTCHMPIRSL